MVYDGIGERLVPPRWTACDQVARWSRSARRRARPPSLEALNAKGSLFLTRPGLAAHATDINEYRERVLDVFDAVKRAIKTYALSDAAAAHDALEYGKSAGAIVLRP